MSSSFEFNSPVGNCSAINTRGQPGTLILFNSFQDYNGTSNYDHVRNVFYCDYEHCLHVHHKGRCTILDNAWSIHYRYKPRGSKIWLSGVSPSHFRLNGDRVLCDIDADSVLGIRNEADQNSERNNLPNGFDLPLFVLTDR